LGVKIQPYNSLYIGLNENATHFLARDYFVNSFIRCPLIAEVESASDSIHMPDCIR